MGVQIDRAGLQRAWRRAEYEEISFVFVPSDTSADVFAVVDGAIRAANSVAWEALEGAGPFAEGTSQLKRGVAAVMTRTGEKPAVWQWFEDLAAQLDQAGHDGRITAAREDWGPSWTQSPKTAGLAHTLIAQFTPMLGTTPTSYPLGSLDLAPELADELAHYGSEWAQLTEPGTRTFLVRGMFSTQTDPDGIAQQLSAAAQRHGAAQALWVDTKSRRLRAVSLTGRGRLVLTNAAPDRPWEEGLEHITRAAVDLGPKVEYALIRRTNPRAAGWSDVSHPPPRPPCSAAYFNSNLELQRRYVPDAYGAQILTSVHLARARDLSTWIVRALGEDRLLVAHRSARAWFAHDEPAPELIAAARVDFGDLILQEHDLHQATELSPSH